MLSMGSQVLNLAQTATLASTDTSAPKITLRFPIPSDAQSPLPAPQTPLVPATPDPQEGSQALGKPRKRRTVDWHRDGVAGGQTSLDLLLDWLSQPNNVDRWRNGYGGIRQKDAAKHCAEWIASRGCPTYRDAEACNFKIRSLFESWKKAHDYKHTTGHGKGATIIWDAEQSGEKWKIDDAVQRVERSVRSMCLHWDQLDPIFSERDGGTAALRADTSSNNNPAFETLMAALHPPPPDVESVSELDWGGSDREEAQETQEGGTDNGNELSAVSTRRGSVRSTASSSTGVSISDRNQRKRPPRNPELDLGADYLRQDKEYRSSKLAKLDEANAIQARKVRAHVGKAIIEAAKILKDLAPNRSWEDCKLEARRELADDGE